MELLFPRVKYVCKAAPVTIRAAPVTIRAAPVTGTNRTGHVETETAPPWEDEDTEAGEDGEVEGHNGRRDRQAAGGQAGGRAEATTGGEGLATTTSCMEHYPRKKKTRTKTSIVR